ncbi:PadR family transcriptional regulator [Pseudonocardia charpentierae]|uniref:Helix-turn-helix transcriptional regulator n=1 Tax=Pseudonocardia charpentierae TaxID=3075545 RepID=A0ABU2NIC3_9PSEU|nr:helix-turn-helix transcriptional regulator [Pseudonocardia sp. DSM 45834]MDT0353455.1 helix-turn-helix transcriptional regulator [Pseudonocardia sp. DSM 45834]
MPRTTTSYAILGLLSVRPWSTYELAKQVRRSLRWFWPRTERKIYDEPRRLVADGLATATRQYTGQRPRTVYCITNQGRDELSRWLDRPPATRSVEFEGMLKLFFADAGSLDQLAATLAAIERDAADRLAELAEVNKQNLAGTNNFPQRLHLSVLALRLHVEQEIVVYNWARWARDQAATWQSTRDPGIWDMVAAERELAERADATLPADQRSEVGRTPRPE